MVISLLVKKSSKLFLCFLNFKTKLKFSKNRSNFYSCFLFIWDTKINFFSLIFATVRVNDRSYR